ncbi:MAG: hypothetical protein HOC74_02310 [Gemmatimonadetes bacterium]|jgi:hypothetical protein|nr:hypothetical protein [Gemmatimonadota bacterium]
MPSTPRFERLDRVDIVFKGTRADLVALCLIIACAIVAVYALSCIEASVVAGAAVKAACLERNAAPLCDGALDACLRRNRHQEVPEDCHQLLGLAPASWGPGPQQQVH